MPLLCLGSVRTVIGRIWLLLFRCMSSFQAPVSKCQDGVAIVQVSIIVGKDAVALFRLCWYCNCQDTDAVVQLYVIIGQDAVAVVQVSVILTQDTVALFRLC